MHLFSFRYLFLRHGYLFLFFYILAVTAGLPIPADPVLLLMGAMVGNHRYFLIPALAAVVVPALLGDTLWYQLGRHKGRSILGLLCRLSLEPDTCVRKTEATFVKRGAGALLFARFLPAMGLLSASLAGVSKMQYWRFYSPTLRAARSGQALIFWPAVSFIARSIPSSGCSDCLGAERALSF